MQAVYADPRSSEANRIKAASGALPFERSKLASAVVVVDFRERGRAAHPKQLELDRKQWAQLEPPKLMDWDAPTPPMILGGPEDEADPAARSSLVNDPYVPEMKRSVPLARKGPPFVTGQVSGGNAASHCSVESLRVFDTGSCGYSHTAPRESDGGGLPALGAYPIQEGLVSKRRDRPYQSGRSKHWVKVEKRQHPAMSRVIEVGSWSRSRKLEPSSAHPLKW